MNALWLLALTYTYYGECFKNSAKKNLQPFTEKCEERMQRKNKTTNPKNKIEVNKKNIINIINRKN